MESAHVAAEFFVQQVAESVAELVTTDYDFESTFPIPNDAAMRLAGRQGLLDQKPTETMSDGDWMALQHRAWAAEIGAHLVARDYLRQCLRSYCVADTGAAPRTSAGWTEVARRMGAELRQHAEEVEGALAFYGLHFGQAARLAFETCVHTQHAKRAVEGPPQATLF